ncbi:MAG: alginate lyase family protein, partial [Actinobacteria bacterium]|nr:alginate lyase family protein [Actinomycetota bacterium]
AKRVDFRGAEIGDPEWIWELNRCQDFPLLTAAWLVSGDDRYADAAADRLDSWIEGHPPGRGIAWSNGFEASVRAISLAVALDALRGSAHLPPERAERTLLSLWQHARWIELGRSTGSSANNHTIGELVGLVAIGCLAPELADSPGFVERGLAGLEHEVDLQIRSDGTSVEQAFGYHIFVIDLLLVATAVLDAVGHPLPNRIRAALGRSGDALWAQIGENELEPTYGDSDVSRAIILDGDERRTGRAVACAIAARLGHAKAARTAGALDATGYWLFGKNGAARFDALERACGPGSVTLRDGGLTILRRGAARVTLDHGPHGHLSIGAHAHADALRLDVSYGRHELVVDPGVGSYVQRKLREAFRSTGFHATVDVDGKSSSTPGGPFLWTTHAPAELMFESVEGGLVLAAHRGYSRLPDPVAHTRAVALLDDESIVMLDRLEGRGSHRYSQRWPLHPSLQLDSISSRAVALKGETNGLIIAFVASHKMDVATAFGGDEPLAGFWSERLESVVPSLLISADVEASGPVHIGALLVLYRGDVAPCADIELDIEDNVTRVRVAAEGAGAVVDVRFAPPRVSVTRNLDAPPSTPRLSVGRGAASA